MDDLRKKYEDTLKYFAEKPSLPSDEFANKLTTFYNAAMAVKCR
jgi:hypothetical protein